MKVNALLLKVFKEGERSNSRANTILFAVICASNTNIPSNIRVDGVNTSGSSVGAMEGGKIRMLGLGVGGGVGVGSSVSISLEESSASASVSVSVSNAGLEFGFTVGFSVGGGVFSSLQTHAPTRF
jgi:hypothetical protein